MKMQTKHFERAVDGKQYNELEAEYNSRKKLHRLRIEHSPLLKQVRQPTSPVTIVAQSGNPVAFVSQSFVLGTWLLDFGASDHMTSNQSLTQLSFPDSLPSITLADGSQIKVCGIGQTRPLPNLSLDSVLFVPGCPFNLISVSKPIHSLNFFVLFVNNAMAAATCEIIWLRQLLQQLQFEDTKDTKLIYNS